jgi:multidrug efflux pump subunit AcrA (membrane-fusion protein)
MFKRKTTTDLVIPPSLENHPRWLQRTAQRQQLEDVIAQSEATVHQIETEAAEARSALDDIRVGVLLGDTASALSVEDQKTRIDETDRRLAEAREQLGAARKAARRVEQLCADSRDEIAGEIRGAINRTQRDLSEQFAEHLEAMQPILTAMRNLRGAHPSAFEACRIPSWDELIVRLPGSKAATWAHEVRALGVDVTL